MEYSFTSKQELKISNCTENIQQEVQNKVSDLEEKLRVEVEAKIAEVEARFEEAWKIQASMFQEAYDKKDADVEDLKESFKSLQQENMQLKADLGALETIQRNDYLRLFASIRPS
ncbi:hypothetical protein CYMTET_28011 [Cymbomonas tetramitiformis]|uniref:Uncharacterized protein n=1 Tax=Cymbomonas tetramitiformis TaxID=36881 RepID=A0AAE0FP00_9CHLO|nr:hypothetical protein CYMTET_28011 [Cymbomonas tetramitiformis]